MDKKIDKSELKFHEKVARFAFETVLFIFNIFPIRVRIKFVELILKSFLFIKPKYKKICFININQVFGDRDEVFREDLHRNSIISLSRLVIDLLRMPYLTIEEFQGLFIQNSREDIEKLKKEIGDKNLIFLSGHLGSFELVPSFLSLNGLGLSIIARELKQRWIESWIVDTRSNFKTKIIPREGAYKRILRTLKEDGNVGIAFDQNVTVNHAVFVDFFGRQAATTFAPASAALEHKSKIVILAARYVEEDLYSDGKYTLDISICDCHDIYVNETLTKQEKVKIITQRITKEFEKMILKQPHAWFWMHKRWKTTENGEENFYNFK